MVTIRRAYELPLDLAVWQVSEIEGGYFDARPNAFREKLIAEGRVNFAGVECAANDWTTRRRVMSVLRQATRVLGVGQKGRIGRLGGGAAIGAVIAGFATPAMAQYSAGGGNATGPNSVAIGSGATATHIGGVATGTGNTATGNNAVAVGSNNNVNSFDAAGAIITNQILDRAVGGGYTFPVGGTGVVATGLGIGSSNTVASGGIAVGTSNQVNGGGVTAVAIGLGNSNTGGFGVTLGVGNRSSATSAIAIGTATTASGNTAISLGRQTTASGQTSVALGNVASASQANAIAIGHSTQATGLGAIAVGGGNNSASTNLDTTSTRASGLNSIALGTSADALDRDTIGIGTNASAANEGDIALGAGATANSDVNGVNAGATAIGQNAVANNSAGGANNSVAIGRQAIATSTAAAGSSPTAIGSFANATGAGSQVAIGDSATASGTDAIAIGGHAFAPGSVASGVRSTAIGQSVTASNQSAIAIGDGAIASGARSISIGTGNNVSGTSSGAIGDPTTITGSGSYSLGNDNTINANNAFAIGNNITIAAGRDGSVGIGNATTVAAPNTGAFTINGGTAAATTPTAVVSVGAAGSERQITNVAAGVVSATSTDAINGSQLFTVATAANNLGDSLETVTGGGLIMNVDGTIATPPSISVGGTIYANVTDAIEAGDNKADLLGADTAAALGGGATYDPNTGDITAPAYTLAGSTYNNVGDALQAIDNGAVGPVQYANAGTPTTPNGGTPSQNLTLVGAAAGPVTLNNVAPGALTATSTQAVNGAQVNTLGTSVATNTGGGSTFDPVTGTVTPPSFTVAGGTQTNTGAAFDALDDANALSNTGISSAIGGGMTIAANGAVTAPAINVNGTTFNNMTDAIQAAGAGFNFTTAAAGTGTMAGTSVSAIGAGETLTVTAGNNLVGTQTGNGVELALNPALTGITSVAVTGGATIDGTGINMNGDGITGLANGAVNATSTDAVTGAQLFASQNAAAGSTDALGASVAANLGGAATYDPATDTVTGLSINVAGGTETNVTDAIQALDRANTTTNTGLANALGGGASVAPDGTVTAPAYAIQGTTYNNVGSALGAVDTSLTNILNGTAGLMQQLGGSPGAGQITVGAATGGTSVSFAGTSGNRVLTDLAPGAITAMSDDAVNGSQIFANNQQVASLLGGGAAVDPATGALTAPSYNVGGTNLGDVGSAIAALQTGAPVQYSTAGAPTTPNGLVPSQNMTLVGAAAGPVTLSNVGPAGLTATSTDAVNGSQINTLASSNATIIGGGSSFDPATGTLTAPTISVGGTNFANVTDAIEAGDTKADALGTSTASGLGGGSTYDPATGTVSAPSYTVAGGTQSNVGDAFAALNTANDTANSGIASVIGGGMAIGPNGALTNPNFNVNGSTYNTVADALAAAGGGFNLTTAATGTGVANGTSVSAIGAGETQTLTAGNNIVTTQNGNEVQVALNSNLTGIDSIALNNGKITGLAAGSTAAGSTEAVNGGQINTGLGSVATNLGGGSTYDPATGIVTAPSYAVQGNTYNNVGSALGGVNTAITNLANGTSGLVQQVGGAPGSGLITVGAATGGTQVSFTGTDGNRILTGLAAGSLTPTSSDAVNGSQINLFGTSAATSIGGGAMFDPATGLLTAPTITVGGTNYANVTDAVEAGDVKADKANQGLADALGGGASVAPDGTVTAPTYVLGGNSFTNVGSALSALANGGVGPVQFANPGSPTTPNGGVPTNNLTLVGAAAGPVTLDNVKAGSTAAGSTQAVNGGQLNTGLASVASGLGGGSTYDPVTGQVTNPSYTVAGNAYNNVGGALGGLNSAVTNLTNGTSGLVQQNGGAPGTGQITVGASTGGTSLSVAGTDGNRTVTGVANGAVTATSADAVNGSQLFAVKSTADGALQRSGGTMTGVIDMGGNAITNLAAPTASGDATNKAYVDGLAAAGSAATNGLGQSTAANLGGGATYNPATGRVSAPSYTVSGVSYGNVGDAIAATNRAGVQYVPDAAGNPTNAVRLTGAGNGQPVALTNVAAGALTATSTDAVNGGQLYAVQQTAAGAVQYDRNADGSQNRSSVSFGTPGTPVQLRNVAPAVVSTDAVNFGQMQTALTSNLAAANTYTDTRFLDLSYDLGKVAKRAYAGSAAAIALQPPALTDAGTVSMRGGAGYFRGEWALGLSVRATADNGRWSLSGGVSGGPNGGVAASAGIDILLGD